MYAPLNASVTALVKFGISQSVSRKEDSMLLRGEGRYTDDLNLPSKTYAVMAHSRHAHGRILSIDTAAASARPGVLGVYAAADLLAAGLRVMPPGIIQKNRDRSPMATPWQSPPATGEVRYGSVSMAYAVAEAAKQPRDSAEAVLLDADPLHAITAAAAAPGAPLTHDEVPGNLVLDFRFAGAVHVTKLAMRNNRVVVSAREPRSAVGSLNAKSGHYTLNVGCPGVFGLRASLGARSSVLGVKGGGEAGCAGSLLTVMNAGADAPAELRITHINMPAPPQVVWQAMRAARESGPRTTGSRP